MSITEEVSFDNTGHIVPFWRKLFLAVVIIMVASLSFGIGRLTTVGKSEPIRVEFDPEISNSQLPISNENSKLKIENSASVYASSKGKRYYYANCSGLSRISAANKVSFASAAMAEAAGLTLASNCQP